LLGSRKRALVGVVAGRQDVHKAHSRGFFGTGLLEGVRKQSLPDELVEGLIEQQLEGE